MGDDGVTERETERERLDDLTEISVETSCLASAEE